MKALVVGANAKLVNGKTVRYDETRVRERSRITATAIEARAQRYQGGENASITSPWQASREKTVLTKRRGGRSLRAIAC